MDVGAAADQQKIAKEKEIEAAKAKTAAINQGVKGVIGLGTMAYPLFDKDKDLDQELKQLLGFLEKVVAASASFGAGGE